MGAPQNFLLADSLKLKGIVLENKGSFTTNGSSNLASSTTSLWNGRVRQPRKKQMHLRKNRRVLMKRRRSMIRRQGDENGIIERKVQTLKRLVPNHEINQGLDGLFRDTASYIMSLQMRVRVMQIMVDVLATSQDQE